MPTRPRFGGTPPRGAGPLPRGRLLLGWAPSSARRSTKPDAIIGAPRSNVGNFVMSQVHGGSVEVFSEGRGKGASFTMTLPTRVVVTEEAPAASRPRLDAPLERAGAVGIPGVRVLVVDDEPDARELVAAVLSDAGGEVETGDSVAEAFDALDRFSPNVVVSDIGLPREDGYSFMRRLRRRDARGGGAIPSLALSADTRAEDRARAQAAGFTKHVGKPVDPEALIAAVAGLVGAGTA